MAKYINKMRTVTLTASQIKEAADLTLNQTEWRWYNAIRKEGANGVAWGCLPRETWKRLVQLGLIVGNPFEVWVKGARR